jgi:hypothetical protein
MGSGNRRHLMTQIKTGGEKTAKQASAKSSTRRRFSTRWNRQNSKRQRAVGQQLNPEFSTGVLQPTVLHRFRRQQGKLHLHAAKRNSSLRQMSLQRP